MARVVAPRITGDIALRLVLHQGLGRVSRRQQRRALRHGRCVDDDAARVGDTRHAEDRRVGPARWRRTILEGCLQHLPRVRRGTRAVRHRDTQRCPNGRLDHMAARQDLSGGDKEARPGASASPDLDDGLPQHGEDLLLLVGGQCRLNHAVTRCRLSPSVGPIAGSRSH